MLNSRGSEMHHYSRLLLGLLIVSCSVNVFANSDIVKYDNIRVVKVDPVGSAINTAMGEIKYIVKEYNVFFEYEGQLRSVRMRYDPGSIIKIKTVTKIYVVE